MLVFFLILCNFDKIFAAAGWATTTVNYLYPMTAMFISFIPLKINADRQKVHPIIYFLMPIVLLAVNAEIFCLVTLLVSFGDCLRSLWRKEHNNYYCWILLSMSIASVTFIITSPAFSSQYNKCELAYFPLYSQISLVQKLAMAVVNMFNYIAIVNYKVFLMGTLLNFFIVYKTDRNFWYKIIAFIPFFVVFLCSCKEILLKLLHYFDFNILYVYVQDSFAAFGGVSVKDPHYTLMNFIILSVVCLVLFCYLLSFHIIKKYFRKTNWVYIILSLGFISYLIMVKSPTIYASWIRPAILVYVAIAISETLTFSHYYGQMLYKKSKDYSLIILIALFVILSIHSLCSQFVTEFRRAQQMFDSGESRVMVLNGLHLNKLVIGDKI
ncbi:MAG: hypothetical protein LBG23_00640 [Endomicrobium sp.]|jgi:hypothetical protein|nr:hypothetical protein [Endomicrobium sp.]